MHKANLKSFSLTDIKNFKNRTKKRKHIIRKKERPYLCPVQKHKNPLMKFLDPFRYHRIISDIIVIEDSNRLEKQYFSVLKIITSLKHIVSVDFYEEFVFAKFHNTSNYPYSSLDLVMHRLRSLGDQRTMKLAETIAEYKELCLLIKNTKANGYKKEILDSYSPKYLNFLKDYFIGMINSSITAEQMKTYMNDILEKNKRNPVFFMMYDEYKDYIGTQLIGFGVNKTMQVLIDWKDLQIFDKEICCVEKKDYIDYLQKLINEMLFYKEISYQKLFIKTKLGMIKIIFEVKMFFVVVNNEKKILVSCVAKEMESLKGFPLSNIESLYDEKENKSQKHVLENYERNKIWNQLINSYF